MHGRGAPDFVVGVPGQAALVELKDGDKPASRRKLTKDELKFRDEWTGPYILGLSGEDVLRQLQALLGGSIDSK